MLFRVPDDAPRADVDTVPVETKVRTADPPRELLLFVRDGLLDSLELVDYSRVDPVALPELASLETPTINPPAQRTDRPTTQGADTS